MLYDAGTSLGELQRTKIAVPVLVNRVNAARRGNASDFALTTLHVYSIIWNGQISSEVNALLPKSPIFRVSTGRCFAFSPTWNWPSWQRSFFSLTSCSHLPAYEPALSKESIESKHVNTPSKSSLCSHSCTYFLELFLQKNGYKFTRNRSKRTTDQHFIRIFGRSSDWTSGDRRNETIYWFYTPFTPMMV